MFELLFHSWSFLGLILLVIGPIFIYKVIKLFFDITICSPPEDKSN